ncbi:unnamed protein product [Symbiodinium sp. CCMP2456]|nr:unnamed protein product [Symbiodinium sp. CCMP2456]
MRLSSALLANPGHIEAAPHDTPATPPASFANYNVPDGGHMQSAPPAPPMRHATHKEKLPQYGSPYLCYPMIALKAPDGAQPTPMVSSVPVAPALLAHLAPMEPPTRANRRCDQAKRFL